jgi:predicted O-methyltransferase YrrM
MALAALTNLPRFNFVVRHEQIAVVERVVGRSLSSYMREAVEVERMLRDETNRWYYPDPWSAAGGVTLAQGSLYYAIVRAKRPRVVVETGVASGVSSTFILSALKKNESGHLYSIDIGSSVGDASKDLPREKLPFWLRVGWLVPESLRPHWTLFESDSTTALPELASKYEFDVFLHDSLHTYNHMMFELEVAWRALMPGGFLMSYDAFQNRAFLDFAARHRLTYCGYPMGVSAPGKLGIARKPVRLESPFRSNMG